MTHIIKTFWPSFLPWKHHSITESIPPPKKPPQQQHRLSALTVQRTDKQISEFLLIQWSNQSERNWTSRYGRRRVIQEGDCWVGFKMLKLLSSLLGVLCNWWSCQCSHAHPAKGWFLCVCSENVTKVCSGCDWLRSLFLAAVLRMCEAIAVELRPRVV